MSSPSSWSKFVWRSQTLLLGCAAALAFAVAGCASSERMMRMSGGVLDTYSAPQKHRLRSEKSRKLSEHARARDERTGTVAAPGEVVNLWPLFFKSRDYFSILWPMADFDPYGMAVRPFYNHEGDDYSILFPLSGWNTAAGDGWVLCAVWSKHCFAVLPIAAFFDRSENSATEFCTPFYIRSWSRPILPVERWRATPLIEKNFLELLLGYGGWERSRDLDADPAFAGYRSHRDVKRLRNELVWRGETPPPETKGEPDAWLSKRFDALPERREAYAGFFPLFHWKESPEKRSLRLLLFGCGEKKRDGSVDYSCFGPLLGQYRSSVLTEPEKNWSSGGWSWDMWLLLHRFERSDTFAPSARLEALRHLHDRAPKLDPRSAYVREQLAKIDPKLVLPETVTDGHTLQLFLADAAKKLDFPVKSKYFGGFLPLFNYSFAGERRQWFAPVLLTYRESDAKSAAWWSLPLLSGGGRDETGETFTVAGPLIWLDRTVRVPEESAAFAELPIQKRDVKEVPEREQAQYTHIYSLGGLFYRGRDLFPVEKENLPSGVAEKLRRGIGELQRDRARLAADRKQLAERRQRAMAVKIGDDRIKYLEREIELEKIRRREKELKNEEQKIAEKISVMKAHAEQLNFALPDPLPEKESEVLELQRRLFAQCAELRWHEDIGHGILFRRENYWNGDWRWHFCGILAGGERRGDFEKSHILQLFYRHLRDGKRSETLCFPFLAWGEDGDDRSFSFMWRLFRCERIGGKRRLHLFFIPF